ncbi:hypothetical protein MFU01_65400 [Myxococcus fulvus]|nr:hypothetical protein MFU01_65400 [Myxococcus fulvus]
MAENPRELIRAAQSAELSGDAPRAVELLFQAATLFQRAGNAPRALQLLRHACRLDECRADIADEVARLERMSAPDADETARPATLMAGGEEGVSSSELALRQRLIEAALREEAEPRSADAHVEVTAWELDSEVSEDLQRLEAELSRGGDSFAVEGPRADALAPKGESGAASSEGTGSPRQGWTLDANDSVSAGVTRGEAARVTAGASPRAPADDDRGRAFPEHAGPASRARSMVGADSASSGWTRGEASSVTAGVSRASRVETERDGAGPSPWDWELDADDSASSGSTRGEASSVTARVSRASRAETERDGAGPSPWDWELDADDSASSCVTRGEAPSVTAGASPDFRFMARSAGARSRARSFGGERFTGGGGSDDASWSPGLLDEWDGPAGIVTGSDEPSGAEGAEGASEVEDETWLLGDPSESASAEESQLHLLGMTGTRLFGAPRREPSDELEGGDDVAARAPHEAEDTPPLRRRKPRIIERGPTRADATLDAWCSFCCRPRAEIGELVAGPAGAFICKSCLTASASLFGDAVSPVSLPVRPRVETPTPSAPDFIGQSESRRALIDALRTGVRCVLLIGAEGCGKSTLLRMLRREGQGALTTVDALAEAPSSTPLFIEDVDRLSTEHQLTLSAFLGQAARPTVVLSARGKAPTSSKLALRGDGVRLNVPTTDSLSRAVRGTLTVGILEHVQRLVALRQPTPAEYRDLARAHLAAREPATTLSETALSVLVAEAARSPRAGHELQALLQRIPPGTWDLDKVTKPAPARKGRRKKGTS